MLYLKPLLIGALTFLPGVPALLWRKGTGGTSSASYCYGVWLKHLTMLKRNGLHAVPQSVAELGPGDTLGVGIAALLCGASRYYAVDAIPFATPEVNARMVDEIAELLRNRAPRPHKGWPDYDETLDEGLFPSSILTEDLLAASLHPRRVARIKAAFSRPQDTSDDDILVRYIAPWRGDAGAVPAQSVELVMSHAVLQSVRELDATYAALAGWLAPGGWMSHQIDYGSFNTARAWNGHWTYYDGLWKLIAGRRPFLINREPHSRHMALMRANGLEVVCELTRDAAERGIPRSRLSPRWQHLSDADLACRASFVQARR